MTKTEENELKTVTFYPKKKKHKADFHSEAAISLSTEGRLLGYNSQLKESLENGIKFTKLLDTLISTKNSKELLKATMELVKYNLDTAYLVFPQQYSKSDFYLIFVNRLLELHQVEPPILGENSECNELYHQYPDLEGLAYFIFEMAGEAESSIYYVEKHSKQVLFYLDFTRRILRFNNQALIDLLVVKYLGRVNYKILKNLVTTLYQFGTFLKEDFGFDVDFGIIDPAAGVHYYLSCKNIPQKALDELFICVAKANLILRMGQHGEAVLDLTDSITITIGNYPDENDSLADKWAITVTDKKNEVSWFDILCQYPFIKDWYLENLEELSVKSDSLYFE